MKTKIVQHVIKGLVAASLANVVAVAETQSPAIDHRSGITLHLSDGSAPVHGVESVNQLLSEIGVRVSRVPIPDAAKPILAHSKVRALDSDESLALIRHFHLDREALLAEIDKAGRLPAVPRGGHLQTSEVDVSPYPKVYDMKALDPKTIAYLKRKFGRLHVNRTAEGVGIDEVMTIVSGGPYTWFFVLENNAVGMLRFGSVSPDDNAWRISYPGLVPHGGYFDADDGLVVAFAHGPEHFVMRYDDKDVKGAETLGDNPWIDFSKDDPVLLQRPKTLNTPAAPR